MYTNAHLLSCYNSLHKQHTRSALLLAHPLILISNTNTTTTLNPTLLYLNDSVLQPCCNAQLPLSTQHQGRPLLHRQHTVSHLEVLQEAVET